MYEQVIWVPTWGELFHIHWPSSEASRQLQGSRRCRRHERVKRPRNRCVKKLDVKATAGWDCSHDLTRNLKTLTMSTLMVEMGNIIISLTSQRVSLAQWISQIGHELSQISLAEFLVFQVQWVLQSQYTVHSEADVRHTQGAAVTWCLTGLTNCSNGSIRLYEIGTLGE